MSESKSKLQAAAAARMYLEMRGFSIFEQHYQRSRSQIDLVATKNGRVYFITIEQQRKTALHDPIEALTASRLTKIRQAADTWLDEYKWQGPHSIGSIELASDSYAVMSFVDNLSV